MKKYKVIIYYSDGTSEESDQIFDDTSKAKEFGESRLICYKAGYISSPDSHSFEDGYNVRYEIIKI